jgi:HD domain
VGRPEDAESRSWEAKTFQASMLRAFAFLVPIFVSILTGVAVGAALPPPETRTGTVVWWVTVFVASTSGLIAADRLTRRLLPLATLLRLSMVFPDRAPSRVKLARRVTGSRAIANELEKAGKAGLEGDRQQAAETILALVGALGDYDSRTRGHSERTQLFVTMLADELKLKPEDKGKLMWAALVHDIGKLKVPHEVLNKPGKPDEHEWHVLKSHPHQGALICEPLKQWMGEWWLAIEQHHEKYDGSGYPKGLKADEIPLAARIFSVVDAYDAIVSERCYKPKQSSATALAEILRCSGKQFDPRVTAAFERVLPRIESSADALAQEHRREVESIGLGSLPDRAGLRQQTVA